MLTDPRFRLVSGVSQRYGRGPEPKAVRLNREDFTLAAGVRKKTKVHPYMLLATHASPGKGDLLSPMYGEVTDVTNRSIFISAIEPDDELKAKAAAIEKIDLLARPERGEELRPILKALGLNTKSLGQQCDTLIVNCLNPDPGVTWAEPMLISHSRTFLAGMEMLRRLSPAKRIVLAVPAELKLRYKDFDIARVPSRYPASVNALVVKAVTGRERPEGVGVVGVHNVWSLGHVVRTGLPLIDTVITIGSLRHNGNYIVRDGSLIGELVEFTGLVLGPGDTIVRGGPLRGESIDRMDRSITKGATGLFLVEKDTIPPMDGHSACVACGSCTAICPARLRPDMLSRYAEFGLHSRCVEEHINSCLECGLCGYVCIARRPILQYIRLSMEKLGIKRRRDKDVTAEIVAKG